MKKPKISFRNIGGSGPLTISWFDGPKGDAIEANNGIGVGFFSADGTLLCVEFDDMAKVVGHQVLEFDRYRVEASIKKGKVSHSVTELSKQTRKAARGKRAEDAA